MNTLHAQKEGEEGEGGGERRARARSRTRACRPRAHLPARQTLPHGIAPLHSSAEPFSSSMEMSEAMPTIAARACSSSIAGVKTPSGRPYVSFSDAR